MLSATFLSAETMASEGTRGLSTYLGFLLGPASMDRRCSRDIKERERERKGQRVCQTKRQRDETKETRALENQRERQEFSLD